MDRRFLICCLAILTLAFHGCGPPTGTDTERANSLHRGNEAEPESLDPHAVRSVAALNISRDLGEGLVSLDADGELIPGAAHTWSVSEDGLRYRFRLRPDGRWSNGDPVTAEDFVAGFRRLLDPATGAFYGDLLSDIAGASDVLRGRLSPEELSVRARGADELEIELAQATGHFLKLLSLPAAFPIHRPSLARHGDRFARAEQFISNGAYRLAEWRVGSHIRLKRNEFYWDAANTAISQVWYYPTVDQVSELNRYRAGELDITANVPTQAFARLREQRRNELKVAPYLNTYYYGFNLTRPPFKDNKALRRALSMVIDRELLVREVTRRGEQAALGFLPPGLAGYQPQRVDFSDWPWQQRVAEARRLYAQAGYSAAEPLVTQIRFNTDRGHRQIAVAIQSMWREALGVETELLNEELKVHLSRLRQRRETGVFRASWVGDYADPQTFAALLATDNPANLTGYANPDYDGLLARAAATLDPAQRLSLLQEAEKIMLDDVPLIPLYFYVSKHLVKPRVRGWRDNALDIHLTRHLAIAGGG
jgi:oligopeptide transport system substrate-binding protein